MKEKRYGSHNYRFKSKTPEQFAQDILDMIEKCPELNEMKFCGFVRGINKGKCPTLLGDSLHFLYRDLEKQILDYHLALAYGKPLKQDLANLINVAGCLFVKLNHLEKRRKNHEET